MLADLKAEIAVLNCANAVRWDSLNTELEKLVSEETPKRLKKTEEVIGTKLKAVVAEGDLQKKSEYEFALPDPFRELFASLRKRAGIRPAVLVVDNLEMIFDSQALMKELAAMIILLDDARYSHFRIKLLIVGVPSGAREYLAKQQTSVANRIT